jgi:hypothetical protein
MDIVFGIVDSTYEPAARCVVCATEIGPGEGLTVRYGVRTLRFKCPGCLERFRVDPLRYLAGHASDCCHGATAASPSSEWACD